MNAILTISALIATTLLMAFSIHCGLETGWRFLFGKDDGELD